MFFPKVCYACSNYLGDNEKHICTTCRHDLPVTNYHFENSNTIKKALYGRAKLENATALLLFQKRGIVQQLLHNLKYRGHETIGKILGVWLGNELKTVSAYKDIKMVIPVPLHRRKLRKRGYNQVAKFGTEIAKALNVPYNDSVLLKTAATQTQVFKKRIARWDNAQELFTAQLLNQIEGKHILLVDDIITTGATIEACCNVLCKAKGVKISVATMAIAQ